MDPKEAEHHFGAVSNSYNQGREPVYDPKPTYLAAKALTAFFNGYRFEKRLDVGGADDYVLVFRKGDDLRFAGWTTANRAHDFLIPLNIGRCATIRHTGQDPRIVTAGEKGPAITLTRAPVYFR